MTDDQQPGRKPPKRIQLERFALTVDGQAKAGFKERASAEAEATKIRQKHPRVTVEVVDQAGSDIVERNGPARSKIEDAPVGELGSSNDDVDAPGRDRQ